MPFRLMPALCILLLAGCASSEPQDASYASVSATPPPQSAPVALAPALHATHAAHAVLPAPQPQNQPTEFPPSDPAGAPQADAAATAVLPPGATNCSTVDGVTLCDAPSDSIADDPSADAFNTDDTVYTN
jgi:hypothetical protein